MLFKIFTSDNFEAVAINEFIGIEESALSTVLLRIEW